MSGEEAGTAAGDIQGAAATASSPQHDEEKQCLDAAVDARVVGEGGHSNGPNNDVPPAPQHASKTSGRKRTPTAAAMAASEQAMETAAGKKGRTRKRGNESGGVSRTSHGGVKIGGRAVTWVGGAGMPREVLDKMGIPQLRALFLKTFNHPTGSNNADWLRKKLSQPQDPEVGAARAAVPRARDVGAEIWTTGTTFKGFTKQERYRLQQMGGNCAAKVVEVIRGDADAPGGRAVSVSAGAGTGGLGDGAESAGAGHAAAVASSSPLEKPPSKRRRKPAASSATKMQIIGAETFEMPPPKRNRAADGDPPASSSGGAAIGVASPPGSLVMEQRGMLLASPAPYHHRADGGDSSVGLPMNAMAAGMLQQQPAWRTLTMADAPHLQPGIHVQVYRADDHWHAGNLESVNYVDGKLMVTIYYWDHDQSEERPLEEFFRGENSLIQWQPMQQLHGLHAGIPVAGVPMASMPVNLPLRLQGMHVPHIAGIQGGMGAMFAASPHGAPGSDVGMAMIQQGRPM